MLRLIDVNQAVTFLLAGELVILPTDTVYGIAALANNEKAIARVFEVKRRPLEKALIWQFAEVSEVKKFVIWNDWAQLLAEKFWPGPLTLILPKTDGSGTLGVRIADCLETREVVEKCGSPLVMPSANISGEKSAVNFLDLNHYFADEKRIAGAVVLEKLKYNQESTIVDLTTYSPRILREGVISAGQLNDLLGYSN